MDIGVIINFLIALSIGIIVGLEREIIHQKENVRDLGGIRTFILISILGFFLTYISIKIFNSWMLFILGFIAFLALLVTAYAIIAIRTEKIGTTTELVAVIVFLLSAILASDYGNDYRLISIIVAVVVTSLLALKENLHTFAKKVKMNEVFAAIKMAVISIIILPLLPNKNYTFLDIPILKDAILQFPKIIPIIKELNIFNPFRVWFIVVFVSGLSFFGYTLVRLVGTKKGIGLMSFLGGMISSTFVTVSLSKKSMNGKVIKPLIFGIVLASSVMFIRILIEIIVINKKFFPQVFLPLIVMSITGFLCAFILSLKIEEKKGDFSFRNPFDLLPAVKFGLFFLFILFVSKILYYYFSDNGIYFAALIAGLVDLDAITISISTMTLNSLINPSAAVIALFFALLSNTFVKIGISYYFGGKKFAKFVSIVFAIIFIVGFATLIFL